jgi:hypothetical protein
MEKEKKSKKKKIFKILLSGAGILTALYLTDKYIPGFNEKITKPVKGLANTVASDVKEYLLKDDEAMIKNEVKEKTSEEISIDQRAANNQRKFIRERRDNKNFNRRNNNREEQNVRRKNFN